MAKKIKSKTKSAATDVEVLPKLIPVQFFYGFKDEAGQVRIDPRFESVSEFSGSFAKAMKDGKWGIIDDTAQWVAEPKFDFLGKIENDHVLFRRLQKWGVANLQGAETLTARFDEIVSAGFKVATVREEQQFSVVNYQGEIIKSDFEKGFLWREGYSVLKVSGQCGLFGENGQWLVPPSYEAIYDFSEGFAAFEQNGKSGYFDLSGAVVIPARFECAYDFSEGLARVGLDGKFGYINTKGEIVIECQWSDPLKKSFSGDNESVTAFKNGYAKVARPKENGSLEIGFINRQGQWFAPDDKPVFLPKLNSFRELNPAWTEYQENLELGPKFDAQLATFRKKLLAAMDKDAARTKLELRNIMNRIYPAQTKCLKLVVSDFNGYDITVYPADEGGAENFDELFEISPLKAIDSLFSRGIMSEPKTVKGVKLLEEFHQSCAFEVLHWICDVWSASGGLDFPMPTYIQNEDENDFINMKSKVRESVSP